MSNLFLYCITALIWGSTWYAIQFQIGSVSPLWSVSYRFALASGLLLILCVLSRRSLKFSLKAHTTIALQGLCLFCLNYILFYICSKYLISGVIALIFATIQVMNIINSRLFLKTPINYSVAFSALIGLCGLILVFSSQLFVAHPHHVDNLHEQIWGLMLGLFSTYFASLGNIISSHNQKRHLPILQTNALGMFYGCLITALIACCLGQKPTIDWHLPYLLSLLYLTIPGTIITFGAYLTVLGNIGPERAAYLFVITPLISLIISSYFENFQWHLSAIIGVGLIVIGNVLVLKLKQSNSRITNKIAPATENLSVSSKSPAEV